jgi:hypothetical protein
MDDEKKRGFRLLSFVSVGLGISLPLSVMSSMYWGHPVSRYLSFKVEDGWCNPKTEGIGQHCFGDFQFPRVLLSENSVWKNSFGLPHPYTPTAMWPHSFFHWLENLAFGIRGSLFLYLFLLLLSSITPAIWLAKRLKSTIPFGVTTAIFGIACLPVFILLDRGNSMGFAIPGVLLFLLFLSSGPRWCSPLALIFIASIRPQFVVFGLLMFTVKRTRDFWMALTGLFFLWVFSLVTWSGRPVQDFKDWFEALKGFDNTLALNSHFPANLSIARTAHIVTGFLDNLPLIDIGELESLATNTNLLTFFVVVTTTGLLVFLRNQIPVYVALVLATSTVIIATAISAPYYLILGVFPAIFLVDPSAISNAARIFPISLQRTWIWTLTCTILFSLVPIPFSLKPDGPSIGIEVAGVLWSCLWFLSVIAIISDYRRRSYHVDDRAPVAEDA